MAGERVGKEVQKLFSIQTLISFSGQAHSIKTVGGCGGTDCYCERVKVERFVVLHANACQ